VKRLFVDTSAWLAYVNRSDEAHPATRDALRAFEGRLVTSNFVFDETVTLCRYRLGHPTALLVGGLLRDPDAVDLVRITAADERGAWELFADRADKQYSFTDCTSFALMRRLGLEDAAELDADFAREGFRVVPPP
jgi:predicted nucleic acid-binding protein